MRILVSDQIYVSIFTYYVNVAKAYYWYGGWIEEARWCVQLDRLNVTNSSDIQQFGAQLLEGLCPSCYRLLQDCRCSELQSNRKKEKREAEEEARRLALETLRKRYCMNCFCAKAECKCSPLELQALKAREESSQTVQRVGIRGGFDVDERRDGRVLGRLERIGGRGLRYYG